jgi:hypothetical protein
MKKRGTAAKTFLLYLTIFAFAFSAAFSNCAASAAPEASASAESGSASPAQARAFAAPAGESAAQAAAAAASSAPEGDQFDDMDSLLQRWNLCGYLDGYPERKFSMYSDITRGDLAYYVMNFIRRGSAAAQSRSDIPGDAWYKSDLEYLIGAGFMPLAAGGAQPEGSITRQDAASLIYSAFMLSDKGAPDDAVDGIGDLRKIDPGKRNAARFLSRYGLIELIGGTLFMPKAALTFYEALSALDKLLALLDEFPDLGVSYRTPDESGFTAIRFYDDLATALKKGSKMRFSDIRLRSAYYKARTVAKQLSLGAADDAAKVTLLHDYLVLSSHYTADIKDKPLGDNVFSPYGVLLRGTGGCESYAKAYQLLLTICGVENMLISGYADGVAHLWNLVRLGGEYYHVDVTWDDPLPDAPDRAARFFLNVTDDIMSEHHEWDRSQYPPCTAQAYNPYVIDGALFDSGAGDGSGGSGGDGGSGQAGGFDAVGRYLRDAFAKKRESVSIRILGLKGAGLAQKKFDAVLRDAANGTQVKLIKRYEVKDCVDLEVEYLGG